MRKAFNRLLITSMTSTVLAMPCFAQLTAVVESVRINNYFDLPEEFRWPRQYDIGPALSADVKIINASDSACAYNRIPIRDTCTMLPISMAVEYKFMFCGKEYHVGIQDLGTYSLFDNMFGVEEEEEEDDDDDDGMYDSSFPPGESKYKLHQAAFLIRAGYLPMDFNNYHKHSNLKRLRVARRVEKHKEEILSTIEFKFYFNYVSPRWEHRIPPSLMPEYKRHIEDYPRSMPIELLIQ